jgi:hypothetical protein
LFLPPLYGYFTKWMIIAAVDSTEGWTKRRVSLP